MEMIQAWHSKMPPLRLMGEARMDWVGSWLGWTQTAPRAQVEADSYVIRRAELAALQPATALSVGRFLLSARQEIARRRPIAQQDLARPQRFRGQHLHCLAVDLLKASCLRRFEPGLRSHDSRQTRGPKRWTRTCFRGGVRRRQRPPLLRLQRGGGEGDSESTAGNSSGDALPAPCGLGVGGSADADADAPVRSQLGRPRRPAPPCWTRRWMEDRCRWWPLGLDCVTLPGVAWPGPAADNCTGCALQTPTLRMWLKLLRKRLQLTRPVRMAARGLQLLWPDHR
jgi:hypothetical protein